MTRRSSIALAIAAALLMAGPALAQPTSVECAASVTEAVGLPEQAVRELKPSSLPVLPYGAEPGAGEFKHLMRIGEAPVGLFVYRVNSELMHLRLFEREAEGNDVLADIPLSGTLAELSYRAPGGADLVTVYCYW